MAAIPIALSVTWSLEAQTRFSQHEHQARHIAQRAIAWDRQQRAQPTGAAEAWPQPAYCSCRPDDITGWTTHNGIPLCNVCGKIAEEAVIEMATSAEPQQAQAEHPPLTVWYGSMPESNGKSNFTAILYRKGGDIVDGITLDRSEYPERVRYGADRARYLIGELKERPWILDYDADKHSGYVAPVEQKQAQGGQPDTIARDLAIDIVQGLSDSEPTDRSIEGMDMLRGTPLESMFVLDGDDIRKVAEVVISNAIIDKRILPADNKEQDNG